MKMCYMMPVWYSETPLFVAVCAAPSLDRPRSRYGYARSDGGASAGRAFGVEGGEEEEAARAVRLLRAFSCLWLPPVASRLCIDESRPRVGTAWYASRFRSRGCVTCRASWTRREVEQCSRASRSRRFVFVATCAGPTDRDDVSGIRDVLKRRRGVEQSRFNAFLLPARRVPRWKIDGVERLAVECAECPVNWFRWSSKISRWGTLRGSCSRTPGTDTSNILGMFLSPAMCHAAYLLRDIELVWLGTNPIVNETFV